jgi:hypothetical protein
MGMGQAVLFARGRPVRAWLPDPEDNEDTLGMRDLVLKAKADITE